MSEGAAGAVATIDSLSRFHVRVNGGDERVINTRGSIYCHVVAAVPAMLGICTSEFPLVVEIWVPHLVEAGYGPYVYYVIDDGDFLVVSVNSCVAAVHIGAALPALFQ